jgi:hypothetical protein
MEDIMIYPDQGALFSEEYYMRQSLGSVRTGALEDETLEMALASTVRFFERRYQKHASFRYLLRFLMRKKKRLSPVRPAERNITGFDRRVEALMMLLQNELKTWASLARGGGFQLHYVLQPALNWVLKAKNPLEEECLREDLKVHPQNGVFGTLAYRLAYSARIADICRQVGINFMDSNDLLSGADAGRPVFTDLCHLTDYGNELLAGLLRDSFSTQSS